MLMTQFSLPVLMTPSADFYIFSNTWPHDFFFSSMDPNVSKCQLLTVHAALPVSLSLTADADSQCNCPFCAPFFFTTPDISSLDVPLIPVTSAKYLGSFITPTPSSVPDVNFRCSQASSPSRHSIHSFDILSLRFKLQV